MIGPGNTYDNTVMESFFKTLKNDLINDKNYKIKKWINFT